jgi:hypothetical protein
MRRLRGSWVLACAVAEAIGMTASAVAARVADGPDWPVVAALGVVVAGGLVEGTALGWAQSGVLARRLPGLRRGRYLAATVLVAGVGWAAASAPGVLGEDTPGDAGPPLLLVLLGAAGLGLVMGPVLGGAQALALRGAAQRPGRWVLANTVAWPPAMAVIFLGASSPGASWSTLEVGLLGTATGLVAGTVLGLLTRPFLPDPVAGGIPVGAARLDPLDSRH